MRGNGLPGEHAVLVDKEIQQEIEFLAGGVQQGIPYPRFQGVGVQTDLVEADDIGAAQGLAPVDGPDTGMQLGQVERLGKIVIRSFFQPDDLIVKRILRGNDQDIALFVLRPDIVEQADAVAVRQADIQQDAIILEQGELFSCRLQRVATFTDIAFRGEEIVDIPGQFEMIFYDQYLHDAKLDNLSPQITFSG